MSNDPVEDAKARVVREKLEVLKKDWKELFHTELDPYSLGSRILQRIQEDKIQRMEALFSAKLKYMTTEDCFRALAILAEENPHGKSFFVPGEPPPLFSCLDRFQTETKSSEQKDGEGCRVLKLEDGKRGRKDKPPRT